jgi:adenosine deaminase
MDLNFFPKIVKPNQELHAHLNGSLRKSTFLEFLESDGIFYDFPSSVKMQDAFTIFSFVHRVVNSKERLSRVVHEVLEDFNEDNCVYLELRTTPKPLNGLSKLEYIQTIENVIQEFPGFMKTMLIISVNRAQSLQDAWENLEIAKKSQLCVGIDFSGNPNVGKFRDFSVVFQEARNLGFKVTVHTAEIEDAEDTDDILRFKPDRLGHCNYLNEEQERIILEQKIPIEICLSSNITTLDIPLETHHFNNFFRKSHPLSISTDDTLLFNTSQTKELTLIQTQFTLQDSDLYSIIQTSSEVSFSPLSKSQLSLFLQNKILK